MTFINELLNTTIVLKGCKTVNLFSRKKIINEINQKQKKKQDEKKKKIK